MASGDASAPCSTASPPTNAATTSEPPATATHSENALVATFLGLGFAVFTTRVIDRRRELSNRRTYIFRTLMATRRNPVAAEHVTALNLIEIDFHGQSDVAII